MVSNRIATATRRALCAVLATSFSLLLGLGASLSARPAAADEPPLVLSSEHIGMSGDEIRAEQAPVAEEPPVVLRANGSAGAEAPVTNTGSEFVSAEGAVPVPAPVPVVEDAACEPGDVAGGAISSFGHCIEASIRGGVGFEESAHVCRALFPDQG
jgi:hypothetical protein